MANPTDGMDPAFQAQFALIRQTFVKGLAARMQAIARASVDPDQPATLQMELHRLAGAAGGYGFDELGALARRAMERAEQGSPEALQQALQQLNDAARAAGAE